MEPWTIEPSKSARNPVLSIHYTKSTHCGAKSEPQQYKYEALMKPAVTEQCSTEFADMMQYCSNYLVEYRSWQ